jgi:hypothetical protein
MIRKVLVQGFVAGSILLSISCANARSQNKVQEPPSSGSDQAAGTFQAGEGESQRDAAAPSSAGPDWTDVVTATASVATAALAGLAFWQLKAARKQLTITTFEHLYGRMQGIHEQFLLKPELRDYFYSRKNVAENDPIVREVNIAAEMLADFFQQVHLQLEYMPPKTASGWKAYSREIVDSSPALQAFLLANPTWYPSDLLEVARKARSTTERRGLAQT